MNPATDTQTGPALRVGVFGGTFNPVHTGHIQTVLEVRQAMGLDALFLVPAALPPHKLATPLADCRDRLAMLLLALSKTPGVVVSDMELTREGPSYSVDTIRGVRALLPPDTALFFILGSDAFLEIDTWHAYRALFEAVSVIVMHRPGDGTDQPATAVMGDLLTRRVSPDYAFDAGMRVFRHPALQPVFLFDNPARPVSATAIRERVHRGQSIAGLVPDAVAAYIERKGLYR